MANQRQTGELVAREVLACASMFVGRLIQLETQETGSLDYESEAQNLMGGYKQCEHCEGERTIYNEDSEEDEECSECYGEGEISVDIYEHWIVSDWLGRHLKQRDEVVEEYYGLTIWGRQCSGQAIKLDGVMEQIVDELSMFKELAE
jgi:hypothetical protein